MEQGLRIGSKVRLSGLGFRVPVPILSNSPLLSYVKAMSRLCPLLHSPRLVNIHDWEARVCNVKGTGMIIRETPHGS